ncbi:MAG: hypothetical protein SGJ05_12340 [bacterium]|nr:hypothetical protein [bacterium]
MHTLNFTSEELAYIDREMHAMILEGLDNKVVCITSGKAEITVKPYARVGNIVRVIAYCKACFDTAPMEKTVMGSWKVNLDVLDD